MQDVGTFRTVNLGFDIIHDLRVKGCFNNSATVQLLQVAFEHGGYIAGGFGTMLAQYYLIKAFDDLQQGLLTMVRGHLGVPIAAEVSSPFRNSGCGDIDVWFPDNQCLSGFINDDRRARLIRTGTVVMSKTLTGAAIEHVVVGDARVQVILRWLLPPIEQISRFDIYNGAVAICRDTIIVPEHWESLEKTKTLHVTTWASPWTINRVFKWIHRKKYTNMTPPTVDHVFRKIYQAIEWRAKWASSALVDKRIVEAIERDKIKRCIIINNGSWIQGILQPIMGGLTGDQLIQLSTLFKTPLQYDFAMQEIHRRMPLR